MRQTLIFGFLCSFILLMGCEEEPENNGDSSSPGSDSLKSWAIPRDEVFDGGPGKDGIPALTEPDFISAEAAEFLNDDELVIEGLRSHYEFSAHYRVADYAAAVAVGDEVTADGTVYRVMGKQNAPAGRKVRLDLGERYAP